MNVIGGVRSDDMAAEDLSVQIDDQSITSD